MKKEKQFWFYLITGISRSVIETNSLSIALRNIKLQNKNSLLYIGLKEDVYSSIKDSRLKYTYEYLIVSSEKITLWDNKKIIFENLINIRPIIPEFKKISFNVEKMDSGISPFFPGRKRLSFEMNYRLIKMDGPWISWIDGINKILDDNYSEDIIKIIRNGKDWGQRL